MVWSSAAAALTQPRRASSARARCSRAAVRFPCENARRPRSRALYGQGDAVLLVAEVSAARVVGDFLAQLPGLLEVFAGRRHVAVQLPGEVAQAQVDDGHVGPRHVVLGLLAGDLLDEIVGRPGVGNSLVQ